MIKRYIAILSVLIVVAGVVVVSSGCNKNEKTINSNTSSVMKIDKDTTVETTMPTTALTTKAQSTAENSTVNKSNKTKNWESLYSEFYKKEKKSKKFEDSELKYAYCRLKIGNADEPYLLLKDNWNIYLFTIENGKVVAAKGFDSGMIEIERFEKAYTDGNTLYFEGASGSPAVYYNCKLIFSSGHFDIEYVASKMYDLEGNATFFGKKDKKITESEYNKIVSGVTKSITEILFLS